MGKRLSLEDKAKIANGNERHCRQCNHRVCPDGLLEVCSEAFIRGYKKGYKQSQKEQKERIDKIKARIIDELEKIPEVDYDKNRMEQEMIYYIEKLDINEEKQRLGNHLVYFIKTIEEEGTGKGKKLGFIAQEMGREINTLGSKSNHAEMQKIVVMMKDNLEQIKEQVLNVL